MSLIRCRDVEMMCTRMFGREMKHPIQYNLNSCVVDFNLEIRLNVAIAFARRNHMISWWEKSNGNVISYYEFKNKKAYWASAKIY